MNLELTAQVRQLLEQEDEESLKFIISDEPRETIDGICLELREDQAVLVRKIYEELQSEGNCGLTLVSLSKAEKNKKIDEALEGEGRDQNKMQSFLQLLSRTNQKLRYMQEYGFPYYDLIKRIMITHGDIHPLMQTVKSLHSQVQFLFSVLFKEAVLICLQERFTSSDVAFRTFLSNVFEKQCEKYYTFQHLYKNLKKSTEEEQSCDEENQQEQGEIPLTQDQTLKLDEKEFLVNLADSVSVQEFQQFNKNRSLNFLCFGIKKFQPFIGIPASMFKFLKQKQFCQLLSFLLVRFIRKIIFTIIRQRNDGKLIFLSKAITSQQITIVGNELSDEISLKIDAYIAPIKTVQEKAKQLFVTQFTLMNYEDFVPKRYIIEANSKEVDTAQYVWQQVKQYKIFWIQRVKAEKYIEEGEKGALPVIQYIPYIKSHLNSFKTSKAMLWKQFISVKLGYPPEVKSRPGKRLKLQSLND